MSAGNYDVCPRCGKKSRAALEEKRQEVIRALTELRKAIPDQFDAVAGSCKLPSVHPKETLREDYELFIQEGVFYVGYTCHCSECNFSFSFKHSEPLDLD